MFRYTALIVLPALVWSCCPPSKWEGSEYIALGSTDGKGQGHYTEVTLHIAKKLKKSVRFSFLFY